MILSPGCQRLNIIGTHTLVQRVRGRIQDGLGIKSGAKRLLRPPPPAPRLGEPSRFAEGQWVRVAGADRIAATLDARGKLRGLAFVPAQYDYCGAVLPVDRVVRRIVDDHGRFRAVARTVLLNGASCGGPNGTAGCGRHCPLMFRDEWLEPANAPEARDDAAAEPSAGYARVRPLAAIRATLSARGTQDGLVFMPEMAALSGRRLRIVRRIDTVYEHDRHTAVPQPIYLLEGAHCSGAFWSSLGPCDRRCAMLWHADWLEIEAPPS